MKVFLLALSTTLIFVAPGRAQRYDSIIYSSDSLKYKNVQCYKYLTSTFCYSKPQPFSFVTHAPKTISMTFKETFSRKSLPVLSAIALSTLVLIPFDQDITNGVQKLSNNIDLNSDIVYSNVLGFKMGSKYIPIYQAPHNLNTAVYSLGEGFTSTILSGGMFIYGKIKRDNRTLQTASQIMQAQIAVGLITQVFKRVSGRESPRVSSASGGVWRPLVSFSNFQNHTSKYDAFPSGHLATMMATVTVLTSNYPEKKWLKPVCYALTGMVGYAMVNNGVHWSGDYPLALGIGYLCGKVTVNMNRFVQGQRSSERRAFRWL